MEDLTSTAYEQLTARLVSLISERAPVLTTRLEDDVQLQGLSTQHQVDVVWEFTVADTTHRVLFECRHYNTSLKQKDVFAFNGVVLDLATPGLTTHGVMVTKTGYQSGAQAVAETYGVIITELREPSEEDLAGRLVEISLEIVARVPKVEAIQVQPANPSDANRPAVGAWSDAVEIEDATGRRSRLVDLLLDGELNPIDAAPTPMHRVARVFEPPAVLLVAGEPVLAVAAVAASVGEIEGDPFDVRVGGREKLAWMLKNTLNSVRAWFTENGDFHVTD